VKSIIDTHPFSFSFSVFLFFSLLSSLFSSLYISSLYISERLKRIKRRRRERERREKREINTERGGSVLPCSRVK